LPFLAARNCDTQSVRVSLPASNSRLARRQRGLF